MNRVNDLKEQIIELCRKLGIMKGKMCELGVAEGEAMKNKEYRKADKLAKEELRLVAACGGCKSVSR